MVSIGFILRLLNKIDQRRDPQALMSLLQRVKEFADIPPGAVIDPANRDNVLRVHNDIRNILLYIDKRGEDVGFSLADLIQKFMSEEKTNG